jgi:3-oxoacyl-[acyl-carrier protein] reductase
MDLGLRERVCVVTGASRGFGRETALLLAAEGARVLLVGRSEEQLREVADRCRAAGGHGEVLAVDVTAQHAAERVVERCTDQLGGLDVLVNNAGTSSVRSLEELTDAEWQEQWELHVMAPMRMMRAGAPVMAQNGWGRIVNVCSSSGKRPSKTNVAYSVTKAAELSLSRAFADQYAGQGVMINAVAPGPAGTELWLGPGGLADQTARAQGITREEALEAAAARVPRGELATESEIASVIVFLCSEQASNVAGAAWSVDGGTVPVII